MKIDKLTVGFLSIVLTACSSTTSDFEQKHSVLNSAKAYTYQKVETPKTKELLLRDYVYYAAQQADKMKFKKFALIQEYSQNKFGGFNSSKITTFMFNSELDFNEIKNYENPYKKLKLLGVFDTEEYKDKRFHTVGLIPGLV